MRLMTISSGISRSRSYSFLLASAAESPAFRSSARYSLLKSTPCEGGFIGLSLVAAVMKTRFPHTTGEDQPVPGTSVTHSTFSVFDQLTGRFGFSATGFEPGPRKRGQCCCPVVCVDVDDTRLEATSGAAPSTATMIRTGLRYRM